MAWMGWGGLLPPNWLFLFPVPPLGSSWPHAGASCMGIIALQEEAVLPRLLCLLFLLLLLCLGLLLGLPSLPLFSSDLLWSPPLSNSWFLPFGSLASLPGLLGAGWCWWGSEEGLTSRGGGCSSFCTRYSFTLHVPPPSHSPRRDPALITQLREGGRGGPAG